MNEKVLHSFVEYYAEHESYRCGYCNSPDTNFSHGLWAHTMTVSDYQDLIDRGWRRSGKYCYKPTLDITCCPMYTIRCRSLEFKASKSQKKVLKQFNKYMMGARTEKESKDTCRKMSTCSSDDDSKYCSHEECGDFGQDQFVESMREHREIDLSNVVKGDEQAVTENPLEVSIVNETKAKVQDSGGDNKIEKNVRKGSGPDPNKGPCKKAKELRKERKLEKLKAKGVDLSTLNTVKNKEKQLEDFINEFPSQIKEKLEVKLVRTTPPSPEWLATAKESHEVYVKYQTTIHNDRPEKCTEPKFHEFLVKSPLLEEHSDTAPRCGYGSFHQQYWLSGKLVAVGVIDILPKCVSSVYFFYDPDYMTLTLGTYGALREIEFTRQLHMQSSELKYYYMGYYIHSCRKMRYKGNYNPSDLLCPETYKWFPIKDSIPKLEATPYCRLNPDIDDVDLNYPAEEIVNRIPVLVNGTVLPYSIFQRTVVNKQQDREELMMYTKLVGSKSAKSLILVR